jgi:uncharacterized membrane protein YdbT with pleckstrin-like domain
VDVRLALRRPYSIAVFCFVIMLLGKDAAIFVAANRSTFKTFLILFVVLAVGVRAAKLAWRGVVLRSHRYRVSNRRILLESGVFSKRIDEVDMRTVEDIEFRQSFFQRLLGIGDIAFSRPTSNSAAFAFLGWRSRASSASSFDRAHTRRLAGNSSPEARRALAPRHGGAFQTELEDRAKLRECLRPASPLSDTQSRPPRTSPGWCGP